LSNSSFAEISHHNVYEMGSSKHRSAGDWQSSCEHGAAWEIDFAENGNMTSRAGKQ
jgi:hypothetical protein